MAALPTPPTSIRAPQGRHNDVRELDRAAGRTATRGVGFGGGASGTRDGGLDRPPVAEDLHDVNGLVRLGLLWVRGHVRIFGWSGRWGEEATELAAEAAITLIPLREFGTLGMVGSLSTAQRGVSPRI